MIQVGFTTVHDKIGKRYQPMYRFVQGDGVESNNLKSIGDPVQYQIQAQDVCSAFAQGYRLAGGNVEPGGYDWS